MRQGGRAAVPRALLGGPAQRKERTNMHNCRSVSVHIVRQPAAQPSLQNVVVTVGNRKSSAASLARGGRVHPPDTVDAQRKHQGQKRDFFAAIPPLH